MAGGRRKVSLEEVARHAGVGVATVDRVLNERGHVSTRMMHRVLAAARELQVNRLLPAPYHNTVRVEMILGRPEVPLMGRMVEEYRRLSTTMDRTVSILRTVPVTDDAETIAAAIRASRANAIVTYTFEHPATLKAIAEKARQGVPTITFISDLPSSARTAYAGTDHPATGRTAAYFVERMTRAATGPVLVLCYSPSISAHAQRIQGFADGLAERGGRLRVTEVLQGRDDHILSEVVLRDALKRHPETVAIYNVGAGNRGVAAAIRDISADRRPLFVGHELTEVTRELLRTGIMAMTIDQNPELQARMALELALKQLGFVGPPWITLPSHGLVPFVIYGPENLPPRTAP